MVNATSNLNSPCSSNNYPMNNMPTNKSKTQTNKVSNSIAEDSLSLILLNFQSVMNKKESFWEMIDNYSPDVVVGCETWLKPSILDNEIFPQNYNLFCTDCSDGFGGVLIGTKMHLNSELIHVSSSCEICACLL